METAQGAEYEPQLPRESERKYIPYSPSARTAMSEFLNQAQPIEQAYLSHPKEPFSLRLRKEPTGYTAALKSKRAKPDGPLDRIEVETEITPEAYEYYTQRSALPLSMKLRAHIAPGVSCDWHFDDTTPLLEIESTADSEYASSLLGIGFREVTNDPYYDGEQRAHRNYYRAHGQEALLPPKEPDGTRLGYELVQAARDKGEPLVVAIRGRSGSGKSTLAQMISFIAENELGPVLRLSTDDYHRGKSSLLRRHTVQKWTNWDAPEVYNIALLAWELEQYLAHGEPIPRRYFDFATEEPRQLDEPHPAAALIIIEGLYAHALELTPATDRQVTVPTPLATSIGRRLLRDVGSRINTSLADPAAILRYQLETAEPTYQLNSK